MDDTPEVIRQQMEETKLQLTEKLETLEHQVSETVQSTGTAVNATVGAVQETVETVTGAVQDAVHSVSNAFDLRRQLDRHPFYVLGGAAVLGYLASEYLKAPSKTSEPSTEVASPSHPPADTVGHVNSQPTLDPAAQAAAIAAAYEKGLRTSSWNQFKNMALGSVVAIMQEAASRAIPLLIDQLTPNPAGTKTREPEAAQEQSAQPRREEADEGRHLYIAPAERFRSGNSF